MTTRYVSSAGSNTSPYSTWATAATSFTTVSALMGAGDITYVSNTLSQTLNASTTITLAGTDANPCFVISTNDTTNNPPTTIASGAKLSSGAGTYNIIVNGFAYIYGVEFDSGTLTTSKVILANASSSSLVLESCGLKCVSSAATANSIQIGASSSTPNKIRTINTTFTLGNNASQSIGGNADWEDIGGIYAITTTVPTVLFGDAANIGIQRHQGSDFSAITTTISGARTVMRPLFMHQCKLATGVAVLATQASSYGGGEVWLYDCAFGNVQYAFGHYNYWGSTVATTAIYENDSEGAKYDVTGDGLSWLVTSVNGTYAHPYVSPWIDQYNEATSAVTPRIEIARNGSATAYNNDQVWAEFAYKGTASVTLGSFDYSNKRGLVAASGAQATSAKTSAAWTGIGGTNWLGQLTTAATITPQAIGHYRGRVCVAGANAVYVNPRILSV